MTDPTVSAPTLELLDWLSARPRSYAEAMEAWRSHCPRLTVWEDALQAGLVQVVRSNGRDESRVVLTTLGAAALAGRKRQPTTIV